MIAPSKTHATPSAMETASSPAGRHPPRSRPPARPGHQPVRDLHALMLEAIAKLEEMTPRKRHATILEWKQTFASRGVANFTHFALLRCLCRIRCSKCGGIIGPAHDPRLRESTILACHFERSLCSLSCRGQNADQGTWVASMSEDEDDTRECDDDEDRTRSPSPSLAEIARMCEKIRSQNENTSRDDSEVYSKDKNRRYKEATAIYINGRHADMLELAHSSNHRPSWWLRGDKGSQL